MPPYIAIMIVFPLGTKMNGLFLFHVLSQQHTAVCAEHGFHTARPTIFNGFL